MMLSNGGVVSADDAARAPIRLVESGPAAGALAGRWFAHRLGEDRLLCFDMGGTTAKACLIDHGEPDLTTTFEVARIYRFKKGSGFPVSVPSVDLVEIGAGGGALAHIDQFGLLKVGPESAGAEPGPASYGRGGDAPTVTDADLVLGLLDAAFFLGGDMPLDLDAARLHSRASVTNWTSDPSTPRRASTRSSTRTWQQPRACTESSRASTSAASRCSPSVAPVRCTPVEWPNCSSPTGSCSRSTPACCRRSARSCPRCASTSPGRGPDDWSTSMPRSATGCSTSCAPRDGVSWPPPGPTPVTSGSGTGSTPATPDRATR